MSNCLAITYEDDPGGCRTPDLRIKRKAECLTPSSREELEVPARSEVITDVVRSRNSEYFGVPCTSRDKWGATQAQFWVAPEPFGEPGAVTVAFAASTRESNGFESVSLLHFSGEKRTYLLKDSAVDFKRYCVSQPSSEGEFVSQLCFEVSPETHGKQDEENHILERRLLFDREVAR